VGGTNWRGRIAMRISVTSWATLPADVAKSVTAMINSAKKVVFNAV